MESGLASWQVENFSNTAEFSPPISPIQPQSPTLYSNAHQRDDAAIYIKPEVSSCSSRAELASRILHNLELEDYHFAQYENQNEMRWSAEESINLELFEDLEFEDFPFTTRPLTPDSQEFKNQERLQELNESPQPSPSAEFPSESFDELSAEFQTILAGLSAQVTSIDTGEVIQLLGVPCTLEEIQLLHLSEPSDESGQNDCKQDDTSDSDAGNSMDTDDQSHTFDHFELQLISLNQSQDHEGSYSNVSSPSSISDEENDIADNTCENILDALLQGDLNTAKSFIPSHVELITSNDTSHTSPSSSGSQTRGKRSVPSLPKSGRGGCSGMKKPRLPRNTDKSQRKKEQNKTAATRYREKKKLQAAIITVQEDALEKVNNELIERRDDLRRQVLIYKELLRAVMSDRKGKKDSASGMRLSSKRLIN